MKHCIYIARVLALILIFAGCDSPTDNKNTKKKTKPEYSFAFDTKEQSVPHKAGGSYTQEVKEKNKPASDTRTIDYSSSNDAIAEVDDEGTVTFKTVGTVTITAIKKADSTHEEAKATYTLYITTRPADKNALAEEIKRAMQEHKDKVKVDLNYINISDIKDMSHLFSADARNGGKELHAFEGDISKWDVSKVTDMSNMFENAPKFNSDISEWDVSKVTNMSFMFTGAAKFNSDISDWNVSSVSDMSAMFDGATSFNQNLDTWEINEEVKKKDWEKAEQMFTNSGLKDSLPSWCKNSACKDKQG